MLKVDLGRLEREWKLPIQGSIPPEDRVWEGSGVALAGPLSVTGEAQQAGNDVVVRGRFSGAVALDCRRCLKPVRVPVEEAFTLWFRPGLDGTEASDAEAYPLPERGTELDLAEALREQVMLAAPQFAECDEACKGLCPTCGVNRNERECDCAVEETDSRWAALRNVKLD